MRSPTTTAVLAALALLASQAPVRGEILRLNGDTAPGNYTLTPLYFFYIYNHAESPDPEMEAFIKFQDLGFKSASPGVTDDMLRDYTSLQISLIRLEHFWQVINPSDFCCKTSDVTSGVCEREAQIRFRRGSKKGPMDEVDVYPYVVKPMLAAMGQQVDLKKTVRSTGVYVLVMSNCGDLNRATVTGTIVVRNPFGFLPGNDYHKMPFYGWLSLGYVFVGLLWAGLSVKHWRGVFNIQSCISAVIVLGLVEAFTWYIFFQSWNSTGERTWFLFVLGVLFSVVKSIFSYILVLVGSMGWGITRPYLDKEDLQKIRLVCAVYILLDFVRRVVTSFQYSKQLPMLFVLPCVATVSMLNGYLFYWVMSSLSTTIHNLKDRRQVDKLRLFENLFRVLVAALLIGTTAQAYDFYNISRSIDVFWRSQWFFSDAVPHILFSMILMAFMFLWAPNRDSQRYAYSAQADEAERDAEKDAWPMEEFDEVVEGSDIFMASGKKGGAAGTTVVGRAAEVASMLDAIGVDED